MTDPVSGPRRDPWHERALPRGRDAMRAPEIDRTTPPTAARGGAAFYLTAGVLIALVLSAGLLYFNTGETAPIEQARQPVRDQHH